MSTQVPETHIEMLEGPVYGVLSTHMPAGSIQSTLVWFNYDGEYLYVNTKRGRIKERNIMLNPQVAILAVDTTNPWKYISISGKVIEVIEEGTVEHLDKLTQIYLQQENYYGVVEPEEALEGITRCIFKIAIENVITIGE
jgi:PPOX class probable F420-dependent enzyme